MLIQINADILIFFNGFDARLKFSEWSDSRRRKRLSFFGANMSSYVDVYNKNEDILVLGEGPTQDLDQTIIAAQVQYPIEFTQSGGKMC